MRLVERVRAGTILGTALAGLDAVCALAEDVFSVSVSGDITFLAAAGDLKEKLGEDADDRDFRTDASITVEATADHRDPRVSYGGIVEFNADTADVLNTEKMFVFARGDLGDVRFGDDDTAAESLNYMAPAVAVGTGGLDGDIIDSPELVFLTTTNTDGTRIIYFSPVFRGWQVAGSFTPDDESTGNSFATSDDEAIDNVVDLTLGYAGTFGEVDIAAAATAVSDAGSSNRDARGVMASALIEVDRLALAGGIGLEDVGGEKRSFYTIGAGTGFGELLGSINWGQCVDCDVANNWNLIFGIETGVLPGASTALELSIFDEDRGGDDSGVILLWSVALDF